MSRGPIGPSPPPNGSHGDAGIEYSKVDLNVVLRALRGAVERNAPRVEQLERGLRLYKILGITYLWVV